MISSSSPSFIFFVLEPNPVCWWLSFFLSLSLSLSLSRLLCQILLEQFAVRVRERGNYLPAAPAAVHGKSRNFAAAATSLVKVMANTVTISSFFFLCCRCWLQLLLIGDRFLAAAMVPNNCQWHFFRTAAKRVLLLLPALL
jgi:hypothetical protein